MKEVINFYMLLSVRRCAITLLFFSLLIANHVSSQNTVLGIIIQGTSIDAPANNGVESQNPNLNNVLNDFEVESYRIAYPGAKTLKALECFEIILKNASDNDYVNLGDALSAMNYEEVIVEWPPVTTDNTKIAEDPDPCMLGLGGHYLENARVREAWEITHGDPNIIIGLVDQFMDYDHDDLQGKIVSIWNKATSYNPTGGLVQGCSPTNHGYSMAGAMAAIVGNDICVEGTGYDSRVAFYAAVDDNPTPANCASGIYVKDGILQAYADGHKIISVSWSSSGGISNSMMQEMIDSGVSFVHSCRGTGHGTYGSIPGVIGVGQANQNLEYELYAHPAIGWDHNVDIYAPCINVCRLESDNNCVVNSGNSSFGAAMTSGIIALIKSVNSNLCPSEIENILELSNQGLPVNHAEVDPNTGLPKYPLMTQGVIDAEAAVLLAQNYGKYVITTNTEWNTDRFVSELTIEPGAELKITNAVVSMGQDASVIVKRNARLVLDNSTMENCAAPWSGIRVWGNTGKAQPGVYAILNDPEQCGIVALKNNASIKGSKIGISTSASGIAWPEAAEYYGGLIDCENSNFINCRKGVEFMQYPNPSSNLNFTNKSRFTNCHFEEVGNTANPVTNSEGVTIWDTDGIEFQRCRFYNLDNDGIIAFDAYAKIFNANQFYNNLRGISSMATYPFSAYLEIGRKSSLPNDFNNNQTHVDARATNKLGGLKVINNEFFGGKKGVYLEGPSNYFVEFNNFTGQGVGVTSINTGIMNAFQENRITCNGFTSDIATYFAGENRQVQVLSNAFANGGSDIIVSEFGPQQGAIRTNQGGGLIGAAGNCFTSPVVNADIASLGNTLSFKYFFRQETTCDEEPNSQGNYTKQSAENTIDCSTYPGSGLGVPPTNGDLISIRNVVAVLGQQLASDPNNTLAQSALLDALTQKDAILRSLLEIELNEGDFGNAELLLTEENTVEAQHAIFGMKLNRGAFNEAKALLNSLPASTQDDIWFRQVQNINIARLEAGPNFIPTSEQIALLRSVAQSESGVGAFAQSIVALLTGERFDRDFGVQDRQKTEATVVATELPIRIAPNPAQNEIKVNLGKTAPANSWLTILDQLGRAMIRKDISAQQIFSIDVSTLPNGLYFILADFPSKQEQTKVLISK